MEIKVVVRDFAFEKEDPRFVGLPHPDEAKRRSEMSEREEQEEGGEGEEFSSSSGGGCASFSLGLREGGANLRTQSAEIGRAHV